MYKAGALFVALFLFAPISRAQVRGVPQTLNLRYSAQISNSPAGSCGCFTMSGFAADANWPLLKAGSSVALGIAADVAVQHTGSLGNANYGLTLTTLAAGPRIAFPIQRVGFFGQSLFGFAHGSNSGFPQGNSLVPSASSFALDFGGAVDYPINTRLSWRIAQLDYVRTELPNATNNWQNNMRVGAGLTFHLRGWPGGQAWARAGAQP